MISYDDSLPEETAFAFQHKDLTIRVTQTPTGAIASDKVFISELCYFPRVFQIAANKTTNSEALRRNYVKD